MQIRLQVVLSVTFCLIARAWLSSYKTANKADRAERKHRIVTPQVRSERERETNPVGRSRSKNFIRKMMLALSVDPFGSNFLETYINTSYLMDSISIHTQKLSAKSKDAAKEITLISIRYV